MKNGGKKKVPAYRQAMNQDAQKKKNTKQGATAKTTKAAAKKNQSRKSTTVSKVSNIPKKSRSEVKKAKVSKKEKELAKKKNRRKKIKRRRYMQKNIEISKKGLRGYLQNRVLPLCLCYLLLWLCFLS